jgi:hypothetical protein
MSSGFSVEAFPIFGQAAAPVEPREGSLNHPALWQNNEAFRLIRPFNDLDVEVGNGGFHGALEHRSLVTAISVNLQQERV